MSLAIPVLGESRNGPVDPISINKSEFIFAIRFENARVSLLAFEELVDEGAHIWKLTIRERTVAVVSDLRQTHHIGDSKGLIHLVGRLHAPPDRFRAEPIVLSGIDYEEGSGGNESSE